MVVDNASRFSTPAEFGHGQRFAVADDEVVEHPHLDQLVGRFHPPYGLIL